MHRIDVPDWAKRRARVRIDSFDPRRLALIVVDMQNGCMLPEGPLDNPHAIEIIPNINRLSQAVRKAGGKVVFLRHTVSMDSPYTLNDWELALAVRDKHGRLALEEGHFLHQLHQDIDVRPSDLVMNKHRFSAFLPNSSNLHEVLRAMDIDVIVITGTVTNVCCESTARDGYMSGYRVMFVSDATAALTDEEHNAALLSMTTIFADVRSTDETIAALSPIDAVAG